MDGFEILFVLLFILFPLLEGLARRRKRQQRDPRHGGPGRAPTPPAGTPPSGDDPARAPAPTTAADMLPDDLWELLTGERRTTRRTGPSAESAGGPAQPGSERAEEAGSGWATSGGGVAVEEATGAEWQPSSYDDVPIPEPVSLEYQGPEAYSLEQPLPPPEVRHARFHRQIDASRPRPVRHRRGGSLGRALRDPVRLRNAVLLAEVLGPPKGLE